MFVNVFTRDGFKGKIEGSIYRSIEEAEITKRALYLESDFDKIQLYQLVKVK